MPIVTSIDKEGRCWLVLQPPYESRKALYVVEPAHLWLFPSALHQRRPGPRLLAAIVPCEIPEDILRASCATTDEAARYEVKQLADKLSLITHREVLELDEHGRLRTAFVHGSSIQNIFAPLLERAVAPPSWPLSLIPRSFPSALLAPLQRVLNTARQGILSWLYPVEGIRPESEPVWIMDLGIAMRAVFGMDAAQSEAQVVAALHQYAENYGTEHEEAQAAAPEALLDRALRLGIEEHNEGAPVVAATDLPPIAQPWSFEEMQSNPLTTRDGKVWRVIELLSPLSAHMGWSLVVERESPFSPQAVITFEAWWEARGNNWVLSVVPIMEAEMRELRAAHIPLEGKTATFYEFTRLGVVQATYKRDGSTWKIAQILQERHFAKNALPQPSRFSAQMGRSLLALLNKQAPPPPPPKAQEEQAQLDLEEVIKRKKEEEEEKARQQQDGATPQETLNMLRELKRKSLMRGTSNNPVANIPLPSGASSLRELPMGQHNNDRALLQRLARLNPSPKK